MKNQAILYIHVKPIIVAPPKRLRGQLLAKFSLAVLFSFNTGRMSLSLFVYGKRLSNEAPTADHTSMFVVFHSPRCGDRTRLHELKVAAFPELPSVVKGVLGIEPSEAQFEGWLQHQAGLRPLWL